MLRIFSFLLMKILHKQSLKDVVEKVKFQTWEVCQHVKFNEAKCIFVSKILTEKKLLRKIHISSFGYIVGSYKNIDPRCNFANCLPDKMSYKYRLY